MDVMWLSSVMAIILGGLFVSGTLGGVMMYRQFGEIKIGLQHLTEAINKITYEASDDRVTALQSNDAIHARIAALERLMINGSPIRKRRKA